MKCSRVVADLNPEGPQLDQPDLTETHESVTAVEAPHSLGLIDRLKSMLTHREVKLKPVSYKVDRTKIDTGSSQTEPTSSS